MGHIYAIGDLHLSMDENICKPMGIFGSQWEDHPKRLSEFWHAHIHGEDTVILAGDLSWALKFPEAEADLSWIHNLPGTKLLVKGNHDLWWTGIRKMNSLYDDVCFLHNSSAVAGDVAVCGSRGWICPGTDGFTEADERIYQRELLRVERSIEDAKAKGCKKLIGVLHFPPTNEKMQPSGFTKLFEDAGAETVVYGHLHGSEAFKNGLKGNLNGVNYKLVSLDYLDCKPICIL